VADGPAQDPTLAAPGPPSGGTLTALLSDLVDYAGLFPPAGLGMEETVTRFAGYLAGPQSWMLGRLVIPWQRRDEFLDAARPLLSAPGAILPWRLSILIPEMDTEEAIQQVVDEYSDFSTRVQEVGDVPAAGGTADRGVLRVESLELKVGSERALELLPSVFDHLITLFPEAELFVEAIDELNGGTGPGQGGRRFLEQVAAQRARTGRGAGKIRTGGVTPEALLAGQTITDFMVACRELEIPYKATAGLHHPLPAVRPLTYEADAPVGPMHGFLNVLAAAGLAIADGDATAGGLLPILDRSAPPEVSEKGIDWTEVQLSVEAIRRGRSSGCLSFGSCSFDEPVDELEELGFNLTSENDGNR